MKARTQYTLGDHVLKCYPDVRDFEYRDKLSTKIKNNSL
jgi:hypothetical protein